MAKNLYFSRFLWLYDTIKSKSPINVEGLIALYNNEVYAKNSFKPLSKRTFHRDLSEMKELFGIDIKFDKVGNGYKIEEAKMDSNKTLLIDSYRYIHTFQRFENINKYITMEPKRTGSEYLLSILEAIQDCKRIKFYYKRYVYSKSENRTIEPYFIKEFKSRWYVVALDKKDNKIKTFALDRIESIPYAPDGSSCYDIPKDITPESYFKDTFGIFKMDNLQVEEVILAFNPLKGKFLKSQPLHHSQEILIDDEKEFRIKLKVQLTHDFKMEILSHGNEVRVITPKVLIRDICWDMENALKQYDY